MASKGRELKKEIADKMRHLKFSTGHVTIASRAPPTAEDFVLHPSLHHGIYSRKEDKEYKDNNWPCDSRTIEKVAALSQENTTDELRHMKRNISSDGMAFMPWNIFYVFLTVILGTFICVGFAGGTYTVSLTNCDDSRYASGQPWPVATAAFYANQDRGTLSANKDWYLKDWSIRPIQGMCPTGLYIAGADSSNSISTAFAIANNDKITDSWIGCIREAHGAIAAEVFTTWDAANLLNNLKSSFATGWANLGYLHTLNTAAVVYISFPTLWGGIPGYLTQGEFLDIDKEEYSGQPRQYRFSRNAGNTRKTAYMYFGIATLINMGVVILTIVISNAVSSNEFNVASADLWEPFFPTCTVFVSDSFSGAAAAASIMYASVYLAITSTAILFIVTFKNMRSSLDGSRILVFYAHEHRLEIDYFEHQQSKFKDENGVLEDLTKVQERLQAEFDKEVKKVEQMIEDYAQAEFKDLNSYDVDVSLDV